MQSWDLFCSQQGTFDESTTRHSCSMFAWPKAPAYLYLPGGVLMICCRILLMTLLLILGSSWANVIILGADLSRPLPKWRLWGSYPLKLVARGLLASMGYYWISVQGSPADTADAPIMVANHISFVDGIIMPASNLAMAVSRAENGKVPFFGVVMRGKVIDEMCSGRGIP